MAGLHRKVLLARIAQVGPDSGSNAATSFQNIGPGQATGTLGNGIVSATQASVLTVVTTSMTIIPAQTGTEIPTPTVVATTLTITNSAALVALTSEALKGSATSTHAFTSTRSSVTASATAAASKSSNTLNTIVPAIVVPVAVILLASFAAFWFFMRRRHRRELENAEFVMAGKGEKLSSRSNSGRSGTRAVAAIEKSSPVAVISEFRTLSPSGGPKISLDDIGVARPLTPKDSNVSGSRPTTSERQRGPPRDQYPYQNFSGLRPSTARNHPPSRSGDTHGRNRSHSSSAIRPPPPSAYAFSQNGPPPRSGPSPMFNSGPSHVIGGSQRGLPMSPRPAPAPPGSTAGRLRNPSPTMGSSGTPSSRAPAPTPLQDPQQGAYNGASPISQYSPIVKEPPSLPSVIKSGNTSNAKAATATADPIQTKNLSDTARSQSPTSPSFLTEENMRIARLANSSSLAFFNNTNTSPSAEASLNKTLPSVNTSLNGALSSPTATSNPSPKLPPPATRSQLIPSDSPADEKTTHNYFSNSPSRRISTTSSHYPGYARASRTNHGHRPKVDDDAASDISDLDAYEDIDAKSDISSLNEFDRFDFDGRNDSRAGSARGNQRNGPSQGTRELFGR